MIAKLKGSVRPWPRKRGHEEYGLVHGLQSKAWRKPERYCRKWATKHEYAELMEEVCFDLFKAILRESNDEEWTDKHRNVMRKLVVEGGWMQQRSFDIGYVKVATKKRARKSTGCPTSRVGMKSEVKSEESRNSEEGREVTKRHHDSSSECNPMGEKPFQCATMGI